MKRNEKVSSWLVTLIAFIAVSSVYLFDLESVFLLKGRINALNVSYPLPLFFFSLVFVYIIAYAKLLNRRMAEAFSLLLPLAIFWQLSFLLIEMVGADPWKGSKPVFSIYSHLYLSMTIACCLFLAYKLKDYLAEIDRPILVIPGALFLFRLAHQILSTRSYSYLFLIPAATLAVYFLWRSRHLIRSIDFNRRQLLVVIFIFMLAFGLRFAWGERVIKLSGANFYAASDDGITYGPRAEDWASGISHSPLGSFGGFGYWVFLGLIYRLFGNPNYHAVVFIQAFLGALVPVFIYYISRRITDPAVAAVSALLVSLNMNNVFTSIVIGMEALFIPLVFLCLFLLIRFIENEKIRSFGYPFFIGILIGITNIVRFEIVLFLVVAALCLVLFRKSRLSLKESFKAITALTSGFLLVLSLFCARNYVKEGIFDFKSRSASIGFTLVEGGVDETKILSDRGFNPFEDLGGSIRVAAKEPMLVVSLFLRGTAKKGVNYLFCPNFGEMDFLCLLNNTTMSPIYRFPAYCQFYIYIFAFAGLLILAWERRLVLEKSILFGYILYTLLIYSVIYSSNARHRAVLEPLFIILMTCALLTLISRFKAAVRRSSLNA
ncbi:glycosyltransferase family 39 protein [Candidatus Omnitrophota bacterium]